MSKPTGAPVTMIVAGRAFPPTLSTAQTAELWGCSAERLYAELGRGTLPVEPLLSVAVTAGPPSESRRSSA